MKIKKWRGTLMFFVVLAVLGLTVGLRLYSTEASVSASALGTTSSGAGSTPSQPTATPTPAPTTVSPSPTAVPPAPTTAAASKTIDGQAVDTPYGPIQVSVTFVGTTITGVTELQAPNDRDTSVEINSEAAPILAREVLKSQSARIDTVSGATYTSDGYARSVQSAIDQL